ncbi:J domain-containing protein, partial [archaeon]|nr:J domain-containing protein [archaeon]
VPTLDSEMDLNIKPGTQPGEIYTIKEKGIRHLRGHGTGSLNVGIRVEIPRKLSKEQQELLEKFAKTSGDHVKDPSRSKKKLFGFT